MPTSDTISGGRRIWVHFYSLTRDSSLSYPLAFASVKEDEKCFGMVFAWRREIIVEVFYLASCLLGSSA